MKMHSFGYFALAFVLAVRCTTSTVDPGHAGGGDDFPNSRSTVASALAQNTQLYSNWNQFDQVPDSQTTDLKAADSLIVTATGTHAGLSKTSAQKAISDSTVWDLSDSALGFVSLYRIRDEILTLTSEKRVVRWDAAARDSVIGNEFILAIAGTIENKITKAVLEYYLFDTDKNGYLDVAFVRYTQQILGIYYQTSVWATSGNDNNFTVREKRRMNRIMSLQILGADTLQFTEIRDADGDSAIFRHGMTNSVTATIKNRSLYPILTNQRVLSTIDFRATLPATDSSHWQMKTFHGSSLYTDGHRELVTIAGNGTDSLLVPNDSAYVLFENLSAPGTTYDSTSVRFSVKLGSSVKDKTGNALLSYVITHSNNHQNLRYILYSFVSGAPVYAFTSPDSVSGTIHAEVRFDNGSSGWVTAVFGDGIFDVTYQPPEGDIVHFKCTKDGEVLP
jgi:hypothetical protein